MVLATKGTVRLARGFTSSTKIRGVVRQRLLDSELHVHQPAYVQGAGHGVGLSLHLLDGFRPQGERRQGAGAVAGMNAGLLDVLEHPGDEHGLAVAEGVHVHFGGAREIGVDEDRRVPGNLERRLDVAAELFLVAHDLHCPAAEDIGGTDDQRKADFTRAGDGFVRAASNRVHRLPDLQPLKKLLESLAILRQIDGVRGGAKDRHTRLFEGMGELRAASGRRTGR